jgi:hypothetical protein
MTRRPIRSAVWCQDNNPSLNVIKSKEMIVDYRKKRTEHAPILIDGAVVEQVKSFKFLGVHITNKLTWPKYTRTVVKRAQQNLFPLRRKDLAWVLRSSKGSTAAPSRASRQVESLPGMATVQPPTARVVRTAQYITGAKLPATQILYTRQC